MQGGASSGGGDAREVAREPRVGAGEVAEAQPGERPHIAGEEGEVLPVHRHRALVPRLRRHRAGSEVVRWVVVGRPWEAVGEIAARPRSCSVSSAPRVCRGEMSQPCGSS